MDSGGSLRNGSVPTCTKSLGCGSYETTGAGIFACSGFLAASSQPAKLTAANSRPEPRTFTARFVPLCAIFLWYEAPPALVNAFRAPYYLIPYLSFSTSFRACVRILYAPALPSWVMGHPLTARSSRRFHVPSLGPGGPLSLPSRLLCTACSGAPRLASQSCARGIQNPRRRVGRQRQPRRQRSCQLRGNVERCGHGEASAGRW